MDLRAKLAVLADAAKYDASCASSGSRRGGNGRGIGSTEKIGICHSYTPDGRCVSLLKVLLTNYCIYDCQYCVNRVTSDTPRARFTVDEVVGLTLEFYKRNYIEGLFLSSGVIRDVDYTMEQLVEVARRLREREHYNGYIHLKAVPGASEALTALAGRYADRLSANIELPTQPDLDRLAPEKTLVQIERTMGQMRVRIAQARAERRASARAPQYAPAGQSTQMIVGATPSTDAAILATASRLYERQNLRRVYYSAYSPIPHGDDRLPPAAPPLVREHRLYQADWLIRFYGFDARELTTADRPNLDLRIDPKLEWALRHRDVFPVDLNRAPKWKLLRIPGVGVRNVQRILRIRRLQGVRLDDLRKLRVSVARAGPFVITADHNPDRADDRPGRPPPPRRAAPAPARPVRPGRLRPQRGGLSRSQRPTARGPAMMQVSIQPDFESWRAAARSLLARGVEPAAVLWDDGRGGETSLLPGPAATAPDLDGTAPVSPPAPSVVVPQAFADAARAVACHRDPGRWTLLYRVLWRLARGEGRLLDLVVDDDVSRLFAMEKSVRRDRHRMTAFVRFRRVDGPPGATGAPVDGRPSEHFVAWHRPDHSIVRLATPFFVRRFAAMRWSILTPDESVHWDGHEPRFGPGVPASRAPQGDALEDLWRTYYGNIFNPARVNVRAMKRELPVRHWKTLPEAQIIPELLNDAPRRTEEMVAKRRTPDRPRTAGASAGPDPVADAADCPTAASAAEFVPPVRELPTLREAAARCRGCKLYCDATQVVFGEGPAGATVMFVGEQPGDQEDRAGRPFVGPAGQLLDEMMEQAGIPRDEAYVTNAVKHFKFEPRGTRRIHAKPSAREVGACRPWLEAEVETVKPRMIVCLGATAAQSLLGPAFRVTQQRGQPITDTKWAPWVMATVHPSSLLRVPDKTMREQAYARFLEDLKKVGKQLKAERRKANAQ